MGLRFIGVVKTATKMFPMAWLSSIELQERGQRKGLVAKNADGRATMMAFVWMDRARRYFITNTLSLDASIPFTRDRMRQVDTTKPDADPERVQLVVPQPKACEIYYATCGKIDLHNRHRQDTLKLETKIETKDWAK